MKSTLFALASLTLFTATAHAKMATMEAPSGGYATVLGGSSTPADTTSSARADVPGQSEQNFRAGNRTQTNVYSLFGNGGFAQGGES